MTDYKSTIAELRYLAEWAQHHLDKAKIANDAADAIEALQAENERLKRDVACHDDMSNEIAYLRKERDQLQAKMDELQKQEPVAYIQTQKGGDVELVWDKDEELDGALYEYANLFAAPKALEPLTRKQIDDLAEEGVYLGNIYEITKEIEAAHGIGASK